jgi:multiple sugar transport system ATP-binding protein
VAIGRCIVREPKIFLFDEPLSNLDAELRVQMRVEITNLHARLGNTMIYVTHDQVEAMTMADRIVVLRAGNIEQVGRPLDLYNDPANRFVAGFIGSPRMNMLDGTISSVGPDGLSVAVDGMPDILARVDGAGAQPGEPVTLGIRPEHISTGSAGNPPVQAHVNTAEHLGSETYLYCTLPGGAAITIHSPGQTRVGRQDEIGITFDPAACHVFRKNDGEAALPRLKAQ